jgi:hypothetical protein
VLLLDVAMKAPAAPSDWISVEMVGSPGEALKMPKRCWLACPNSCAATAGDHELAVFGG